MELTWRGTRPLQLPGGEERGFLADGDTVTLTAWCERPGLPRIGFGSVGATVLPDLENQIATSKITTPLDFQDRLSSFRGAAFGLEPVLWQSAWFRPHNQSEDVKRLYLVGAGTHPGAGIPGVVGSAKATAKLMLEDAS